MSASQPRVAVSPMEETMLGRVPRTESWWERLGRKEVLIMSPDAKAEAAQRVNVTSVLANVISAAAVIAMLFFSIFNNYSSSDKDDSQALSDMRERVTRAEGETTIAKRDAEELRRNVERLEVEKRDLTRRVEKVEGIIGLKLTEP